MKSKDHTKNNQYVYAVVAVVVIILAGAWYFTSMQPGQAGTAQNPEQTLYNPPEGNPSIAILSPNDGDTISSTSIGIRVNVTNFRLAAITNRPNRQNEGHIHFYLDGQEKMSSLTTFAFSNVAKGIHTITVELRNNDHSPLVPPVRASIMVTVE